MTTDETYITLRESEKEPLDEYIATRFGQNRVTKGAAIKILAENALEKEGGEV